MVAWVWDISSKPLLRASARSWLLLLGFSINECWVWFWAKLKLWTWIPGKAPQTNPREPGNSPRNHLLKNKLKNICKESQHPNAMGVSHGTIVNITFIFSILQVWQTVRTNCSLKVWWWDSSCVVVLNNQLWWQGGAKLWQQNCVQLGNLVICCFLKYLKWPNCN